MLKELLEKHRIEPAKVIACDWKKVVKLDLSKNNQALEGLDLNSEEDFGQFIFNQLPEGSIGYGGYGEERSLYSRSDLFSDEEPRTIHLGVDLWSDPGTPVFAPLEGKIHSFDNRAFHGDYGPVIILEHLIGETKLYSLYGHLSLKSLEGKSVGQVIKQDEQFAWLGDYAENFHWPPHLHFQLIWDMQGKIGDYPGVCKASERKAYLQNCPNPALLLC